MAENVVAGLVAETVVDGFEMVKVDQDERQWCGRRVGAVKGIGKDRHGVAAVGQAGQAIGAGRDFGCVPGHLQHAFVGLQHGDVRNDQQYPATGITRLAGPEPAPVRHVDFKGAVRRRTPFGGGPQKPGFDVR